MILRPLFQWRPIGGGGCHQLIRDGVSDMHCMSDMYLAEELKQEYEEKVPEKAVVKERIK